MSASPILSQYRAHGDVCKQAKLKVIVSMHKLSTTVQTVQLSIPMQHSKYLLDVRESFFKGREPSKS